MKTKRAIILNSGTKVPAGTDLQFANGEANFNGEQIRLEALPIEACEYEMHSELHPAVWQNNEMLPDVRAKLLKIAQDFYKESEFKATVQDIILTGSMANYNYHDKSDLDVHVVIDFNDEGDAELAKKAANAIRWKWNTQHNISIAGHDVELYIQDSNEEHTASGIYSLPQGKWLVEPEVRQIATPDADVQVKVADIVEQTEQLEQRVTEANSDEELEALIADVDELRYKALHLRRDSFEAGEDEFSVGNLAFKELRNNGTIGKLLDLETRLYDKKMSIASEADKAHQTFAELRRAIVNLSKNGHTPEDILKMLTFSIDDIRSIIADGANEDHPEKLNALWHRYGQNIKRFIKEGKSNAEISDLIGVPVDIIEAIIDYGKD